jgi:hypothetical protein
MKKRYGLAILLLIIIPCLQAQATLVRIEPQSVRTKEVFTVDVVCDPTEPVKGWEFKVSYDARTLKLIDIREGDFFHGYQTFYRSNGTIAYGLIMGKDGNVSEKGVVATITFQALRHRTTTIRLVGTGVCNERMYIPITVVDGNVKIKKWFIFPDRLMTACGL